MKPSRFLAAILLQDEPSAELIRLLEAAKRDMTTILNSSMLRLFCESGGATVKPDGREVVVGPHFVRGSFASSGRTADEAARRRASREDNLVASICFRSDEAGGVVEAARDPSGMAPCLYVQTPDALYLFSDIETGAQFGLVSNEIDWTTLAHFLAYPHLRTGKTCLAGVNELRSGMRIRAGKGGSVLIDTAWTPWPNANRDCGIRRFDDAVETLREMTIDAVKEWADFSGRIILELSGGLDSSIVAACLEKVGADFACVTFAADDAGGDEREHARAVASALGVQLLECKLDPGLVPFKAGDARCTAFPNRQVWHSVIDKAVGAAAEETKAAAVFSGGGGDNVFCYLTTASPAADALRAFGPGPAFICAAADIASLYGTNIWRVARMAARKAWRPGARLWPRSDRFLRSEALPHEADVHPWFAGELISFPGKLEHAASIACAVNASDGTERYLPAPLRYPLLSPPLIERCLQIPTWMWVKGGRDRAVARDAFADMLPDQTLRRRSKGDLTGLIAQIYHRNKSEILSLLMDGRLSEHNFIDRDAVAARMGSEAPFEDASFTQLVSLAGAESWVQSLGG